MVTNKEGNGKITIFEALHVGIVTVVVVEQQKKATYSLFLMSLRPILRPFLRPFLPLRPWRLPEGGGAP